MNSPFNKNDSVSGDTKQDELRQLRDDFDLIKNEYFKLKQLQEGKSSDNLDPEGNDYIEKDDLKRELEFVISKNALLQKQIEDMENSISNQTASFDQDSNSRLRIYQERPPLKIELNSSQTLTDQLSLNDTQGSKLLKLTKAIEGKSPPKSVSSYSTSPYPDRRNNNFNGGYSPVRSPVRSPGRSPSWKSETSEASSPSRRKALFDVQDKKKRMMDSYNQNLLKKIEMRAGGTPIKAKSSAKTKNQVSKIDDILYGDQSPLRKKETSQSAQTSIKKSPSKNNSRKELSGVNLTPLSKTVTRSPSGRDSSPSNNQRRREESFPYGSASKSNHSKNPLSEVKRELEVRRTKSALKHNGGNSSDSSSRSLTKKKEVSFDIK